MLVLAKKLYDGRYVFDKDGVIFCVTMEQVAEMLEKIHIFEENLRIARNKVCDFGETL